MEPSDVIRTGEANASPFSTGGPVRITNNFSTNKSGLEIQGSIPAEEPVAFGNAVEGLILAVIGVLSAFGIVDLTPEQTTAVLGVWVWGLAVQTILVRRKVTPDSHL